MRKASPKVAENRGKPGTDGSSQFFLTCVVNRQTVGLCPQFTFSSSTNRITTSGYSYDAAGNVTNDGVHAYTWDAEGRIATVDAGSTATYTYDALGQRVYGVVGGNPEIFYMYDPAGNLLYATMTNGWGGDELTEPVAGRVLASYVNGQSDTYFKHANALGSWGLTTAHDGSVPQDQLYYPWGQTWTSGHYLFEPNWAAMSWYNAESNLFLTPARSYGSRLGRWMSPDLLGGDITNPQSLNRYAYVLNNPASLTDPLGLQGSPPGCPQGMNTEYCYGGIPGFFAGGTPSFTFSSPTWDEFNTLQMLSNQLDWLHDQDYTTSGLLPDASILGAFGLASLPILPFDKSMLAQLAPTACSGQATFSAVAPDQATGPGALAGFGVLAHQNGGVAVNPAVFGLQLTGTMAGNEAVQQQLAIMSPYISIYPSGLNLYGGPAPPYFITSIGDRNIRNSAIARFDIFNFPSHKAADLFGIQTVPTVIVVPGGSPCPRGFSGGH